MIQRILVALDADTDTPVATRYAAEVARRYGAQVTAVAVVDMESIARNAKGAGIGAFYLMEKVEASLTQEARGIAGRLVNDFKGALSDTGIAHESHIAEGVPIEHIVEAAKYSDLLVVGKVPHFHYSHPEATPVTLEQIVERVVGPALTVPSSYREVRRVLVAFDGSRACVRALRGFLYLKPFGAEVPLDMVNVQEKGRGEASQLMLQRARAYASQHGFTVSIHSLVGADPSEEIMQCAARYEADLLVAGAHSVTALSKIAFGSTTSALLSGVTLPMWLAA